MKRKASDRAPGERREAKEGRAKDRLRDLQVRPAKSRGQNFVIDSSVVRSIVEFGDPQPAEKLIEIGPGLGALTAELAAYPDLTLIEIEPRFCAELREKFPSARIVNADVREVDLAELGGDLVIFGNLPYSFSTEIITWMLDGASRLKRAVLMLQKEFAERLAAPPGGKDYGAISVGCQLRADIRSGPIVPGNSFHPPASVESMVIELRFLGGLRHGVADPEAFRRVVKAAFMKRRKKILNSMKSSGYYSGEAIAAALEAAGIDPGRRAETLSLEEFVKLYSRLGGPLTGKAS